MASIYLLSFEHDPRVYVGQTTRNINKRLKEHIQELNASTHHSHKLQSVWPACGMPKHTLLEECSLEILDSRETYWVSKYDSFNNGFNCTAGGQSPGYGAGHISAKHTLDDYKCILVFLAYTKLTQQQIADETGINIYIVTNIASGTNHQYLKELMPVEYELMQNNSINGKIPASTIVKYLKSPEGTVHKLTNTHQFCREQNLDPSATHRVLKGKQQSHHGWTLATEGTAC